MAVITAIKPQKNGKRVNIYLDDKFGFGLDLQTLLKEGLKLNQEITDSRIESIIKSGEFQDIYDKLLKFASLRPRSEKEYRAWIRKHKVHKSIHDELFNRLKRLELMDDAKFALWWVGQRNQFRPKPKRVIVQELTNKGVDRNVIEDVLLKEKIDERKIAKRIMAKKEYFWKRLSGFEKRKKMFNFLMQKGFNTEVIRDVLADFKEEED